MADFFRKLNLAVPSVLMLACLPVDAQDVSQAELARCAAKPTAAEKLACYEGLTVSPEPTPVQPMAESKASAQRGTDEAQPSAPANVVDTKAAEPPAPANAVDEMTAKQNAPVETVVEAIPAAIMPVASEPAAESRAAPAEAAPGAQSAAPAAVASDTPASVPDDLGIEQLQRDDQQAGADPSPMTATVSKVTESSSGRLYFEFSNGQVWRQIEPRRFRYPKNQEFEVTVSQGMMGDYRLRVGGKGPMTRIRRVE